MDKGFGVLLCKEMVSSEWLEHRGLEPSPIASHTNSTGSPLWNSLSCCLLLSLGGRAEAPDLPAGAALQAGASA